MFFLFLFLGFQKVNVAHGCSKTYQYGHNCDEDICAASCVQLKHDVKLLDGKSILLGRIGKTDLPKCHDYFC